MIHGLWNCAVKASNLDEITRFYVEHLGGEVKLSGEVFECRYNFHSHGTFSLVDL